MESKEIKIYYYESKDTAHEWLTWRRSLMHYDTVYCLKNDLLIKYRFKNEL
jgi:hypothetical protein